MAICVPDTLTIDNSEKYEVSIRLWPGGLSFSGCIPMDKNSFFSETVFFGDDMSIEQSLKNIFFDNQSLSYVYHSLYVICTSRKYTLVPDNVLSEKDKELLFSFCHKADKADKILVQSLTGLNSSLLFGINNEIYEFFVRSLINPRFIHSLSPLLIAWQKNSFVCYPKQVYVVIHNDSFDIICFERGEMLFVNSYDHETDKDIVYYIMYVCKQLGVNQLEDSIYFCGNKIKCQSVMSVVKKYIKQIDFLSPELKKYNAKAGQNVFMDVVTLTECGL